MTAEWDEGDMVVIDLSGQPKKHTPTMGDDVSGCVWLSREDAMKLHRSLEALFGRTQ